MRRLTPQARTALKNETLGALAKYDPVVFAQHSLQFDPDPWQAEFLRSRSKRIILNCSRQSGKSTITAILALWEAIYIPKSVIVIDSPSLRQSQELMLKLLDFLKRVNTQVRIDSETKLSARFANRSRVLALPGSEKTIRGISAVTLFVEDEAARVPDDLYNSIRPMLAVSNGRLVLMSTPFGKRGHFHTVWSEGRDWQRFEIHAEKCPRISAEFLQEEREGNPWFEQEYHCAFLDTENQLFRYDDVIAAFRSDVKPLVF